MTPTSKQRIVWSNKAERIYVEKQHFVTQCSSFRKPVCVVSTQQANEGHCSWSGYTEQNLNDPSCQANCTSSS
jgi:hypothetical protein